MVDGEGTPGAQSCFGGMTLICCVDPEWSGVPPPPPTPDELTVKSFQGNCPFAADGIGSLHGAQSNQFLRRNGPVQQLFEADYVRFLNTMLHMPEWQPCAINDAAAVLLDAEHGVIRAAYDEDRAYWAREGDANEQLAFFQAWTRLRLAAVKTVVEAAMVEISPPQVQLTACGMAQPGEVGALCSVRQLTEGKCYQGTLLPECLSASDAGYDSCGCPPGYGWSDAAGGCKPAAKTSADEARRCTAGDSVLAPPSASVSAAAATAGGADDDSPHGDNGTKVLAGVIVTLLVVGAAGGALGSARIRDTLKPKPTATEGIYEQSADGNSISDDAGVGTSDIVLEKVDNPSSETL